MQRFLILLLAVIFPISASATVLEAGVSIDEVPKALYGTWSVKAVLDRTNSPATFKPQSLDNWSLSRLGDIITLDNHMTGASAKISVRAIEGNLIVFSKRAEYDNNKILTDTVTVRLDANSFTGINTLTLETFSLVDKHLMKSETASYNIKGEKIAGDSVIQSGK